MPKKDLKHNILAKEAIPYTAEAANGAVVGNIIDRHGFDSLTFLMQAFGDTDGSYVPSITVGNLPDLSDGIPAETYHLLDSYADATLSANPHTLKTLGYNGGYRYARMTVTASNVTVGANIAVTAILGHPQDMPTTTS